jgi:signal peptidase I
VTAATDSEMRGRVRRRLQFAAAAALVVASVFDVRTQFVDLHTVASDSMSPTVCVGDTVVVSKLHGDDVSVDDIVTFRNPEGTDDMIKRVVAVAGQQVRVADAELLVDGVRIDEPWVDHRSIDGLYFGPVTVPDGSVFVLGDHREVSIDSRHFGPVAVDALDSRLVGTLFSHCP